MKNTEWKNFDKLNTDQITNMTSQLKNSLTIIKDEMIRKREQLKKLKNGN